MKSRELLIETLPVVRLGPPGIIMQTMLVQKIGQGSFGKVFRVRKRDNGKVYAMKSMSKKQLINNNQVRYAVTEALIMK